MLQSLGLQGDCTAEGRWIPGAENHRGAFAEEQACPGGPHDRDPFAELAAVECSRDHSAPAALREPGEGVFVWGLLPSTLT